VQGDNRELPTTANAETASPLDHHPYSRNRSRSKSGGFCLETIRPKNAVVRASNLDRKRVLATLALFMSLLVFLCPLGVLPVSIAGPIPRPNRIDAANSARRFQQEPYQADLLRVQSLWGILIAIRKSLRQLGMV